MIMIINMVTKHTHWEIDFELTLMASADLRHILIAL